jgi:hypothetical protein
LKLNIVIKLMKNKTIQMINESTIIIICIASKSTLSINLLLH